MPLVFSAVKRSPELRFRQPIRDGRDPALQLLNPAWAGIGYAVEIIS